MAVHTVNIDVVDPTSNNPIAVICVPQPCENYAATAYEVKQLIQIAKYYVYEAGTQKTITGKNYYDYFPEEGGGGSGSVTPSEVEAMISARIDSSISDSSTNAIQNKTIKSYVDTGLSNKVDTSSLATVATTGAYSDLSGKPTVDSSVSTKSTNAVQNAAITNFINSSIETSTAEFKGTFETKSAMDAVTADLNDYAFLIVKNNDQTINHYERYKWVETLVDNSHWVFEYNLNNSSYTSEQWAAINSGIKDTDISQIGTNASDISDLKTGKLGKTETAAAAVKDNLGNTINTYYAKTSDLSDHTTNQTNPHNVTKSQVGLGNVDNTADVDKPVSTATQTALDSKIDTAGTGLSKFRTTLNHSNSVTAKTSQSFAQIAYDAQGHITGSTPATTAQVDAINSGIDSTKVDKISTNETKISYLEQTLAGLTISRLIDFENDSTDVLVGDLSRLKAFSDIGRCNLNDAGEITAWYGDSNYSETGSNGQVMVWIPKFYYRVEPLKLTEIGEGGLGGYHLSNAIYSISDFPMAGYKLHPAFVNEAGHEVDGFFIGAFEACTFDVSENAYNITDNQLVDFTTSTGDLLASIGCSTPGDLTTGAKPTSGLSQKTATRPNFEIIATNRGPGWHSCLIKQMSAVQMLMLVEGGMVSQSSTTAKCNSQFNFGRGVVDISDKSSYNCASLTGSTTGNTTGRASSTYNEINGTKTEYTSNGRVSVNWRGIENIYGNIWTFIWGMNIWGDGTMRGGAPYICNDFNFAESINSGNYQHPGFTCTNSFGYISAFGYNKEDFDWLMVGSDISGGEYKMIGDYNYTTSNLDGYRIAPLGGYWNNGNDAGAFFWSLSSAVGTRYRSLGSRIMYIPQT